MTTAKRSAPVAKVRRQGKKVWIEGVEQLKHPDRFNSIVACLEVSLRAMGDEVSYEYLMGASGAAFRVQVHHTGPCPCAPHANIAYRCGERAVAAVPWDVRWVDIKKDTPASAAAARQLIIASIDQGVPVLWSSEECSIAVGYEDGGQRFVLRTFWDKEDRPSVHNVWPWGIGILSRKARPPDRREVLLGSLQAASEMADVGRMGDILVGFPAYERWIAFLRDDALHQKPGQEQPKGHLGNAWCYDNLVDCRSAAAKYLRAIAGDFGPDAAGHLMNAAELYTRIETTLRAAWGNAPYDRRQAEGESWTRQMRHAEAKALEEAMAVEKQAVTEIREALTAEGIKPPVLLKAVCDAFEQADQAAREEFGSLNPVRTDMLMQLICLRGAGVKDIDYETLVMLSGFGTSFAYDPVKFWMMYQPPDPPDQTEARIARGTGLGWEWITDVRSADQAWGIITASIDAGNPVQGRWLDDYVFAGYQDAAAKADRRIFVAGGWDKPTWQPWSWLDQYIAEWGRNPAGIFGRHAGDKAVPKAPPKDIAVDALTAIIRYAEQDPRAAQDRMKDGKFGWAGLDAYAADVADTSKGPDSFDGGWLGCHAVNRQSSGRKCAAAWLARAAAAFPDPAAGHIRAAAREYQAAYAAWDEFTRHLGAEETLELAKIRWADPKARSAGAAAVRKALKHEQAAVEAVRRALASLRWGTEAGALPIRGPAV